MAFVEAHDVVQTLATVEPMILSTYGFCQGERGAVTTSVMPIASTRRLNTVPYEASRSRTRKRGAVSRGNASVT